MSISLKPKLLLQKVAKEKTVIYSIGHSDYSIEKFKKMLEANKIKQLADVRSYPGSRHAPQFNKENIPKWLDIKYKHLAELGGRRKSDKSVNPEDIAGWKHPAFKNYAAYTQSKEYKDGIKKLIRLADKERTAYMCSESVPWRCHRSLISNTLAAKGLDVRHIMSATSTVPHSLGMYGAKPKINKDRVTYPDS